MLNRNDAAERLKTFQVADWTERRLAAFGALPPKAAEVGRGLLSRDSQGRSVSDHKARTALHQAAVKAASELSENERRGLFATFFPRLAVYMDRAWRVLCQLPYSTGHRRRGFRAPDDPTLFAGARGQWLFGVVNSLTGYDPDMAWVATWAVHLGMGANPLGILLAAALDAGGPDADAVFDILRESAAGQHEIAGMGRHVVRALLVSERPEAWEYVEKLLLAAQRQEGLRQVILETVDEAHPQAFRRMLGLILDENLLRFAAVVRAVDVWFGLNWTVLTPAPLLQAVGNARRFLDDPAAFAETLRSGTGEDLYLALWALAFPDAPAAVAPTAALLADPEPARRFLAVYFLGQMQLPSARSALVPALDDPDLRVALLALQGCDPKAPELFEPIERLLRRTPSYRTLPPLVWPWMAVSPNPQVVAHQLLEHLGQRPATAMLPYFKQLSGYGRGRLIDLLAALKPWDAAVRDTLFALVGDREDSVREKALKALQDCSVSPEEAPRLEDTLTRKGRRSGDFKRGVLTLLVKQADDLALVSADRLLAAKNANQRDAALELLRRLVEEKRCVDGCRRRAERVRDGRRKVTEVEKIHLDVIFGVRRDVPTLNDALGLLNPAELASVVPPRPHKVTPVTPAALALTRALDELVAAHAKEPVQLPGRDGPKEHLLGAVSYHFPEPPWNKPAAEGAVHLPLRAVWEKWFADRPPEQRDADGLELLRANAWSGLSPNTPEYWNNTAQERPGVRAAQEFVLGGHKPFKLQHDSVVFKVIRWLLYLHPSAGAVDFALNVAETVNALAPPEELTRRKDPASKGSFTRSLDLQVFQLWSNIWVLRTDGSWRAVFPWMPEQCVRLYRLTRWRERPLPEAPAGDRVPFDLLLDAYRAGGANLADVTEHVLGPRHDEYRDRSFTSLERLTARRPPPRVADRPELRDLADRLRARILEIELARGELPTAASVPALHVKALFGLDTLLRVLRALGNKPLDRRTHGETRSIVLSHFVRKTFPLPEDTPEVFAGRVKAALKAGHFPATQLLPLAFQAPQWLPHVEHFLRRPSLSEGVWWLLAHMGGRPGVYDETEEAADHSRRYGADKNKPTAWERLVRERSTLTEQERNDGGTDVAWFRRVYEVLGPKRWEELAAAAAFGCTDQGHHKALLRADVLRGKADRKALIAAVRRGSRDPVRLLGLMPLDGGRKRETDLTARYQALQAYRRYARALSPMSREQALRTAEIGLENLARTAGYSDRTRLEWTMEAREIADLAAGPVSATADGVTVTLSLDAQAKPEVSIRRGDRPLKAIPPKVRKVAEVARLTERVADLRRQASRVRLTLEEMMVRGDTFSAAELRQLFAHPLVRPLLERLVLLGEGVRGYPVADGKAVSDHADKVEPLKPGETLRIAHPTDLLAAGDWDRWQAHLFRGERVQPFKQVFRETYVVTAQEKADGSASSRYANHQVNPSQAAALFGARGWSTRDGVSRTFHAAGLIAEVSFKSGPFSPLEVEAPTLDTVRFRKRGEWTPLPLKDVPGRLFSEVMRDLDLVVSVAHVGGVDPEASASTVEMRAALLRETCTLLRISNYEVRGSHVVIKGKLGRYGIHLGSASVHKLPGGAVCIVAVPAQHRGRLFLPFADDDPRTAEVLSKVLLLARDHEIQDPTILEQLR